MRYLISTFFLTIPLLINAQLTDRKQYTQPGGLLTIGELHDVNGDGFEEYFVHSEGSYYVKGVGSAQWADIVLLSGSFDRHLMEVADIDGDDLLDIVGYDLVTDQVVINLQVGEHQYNTACYEVDLPSPAQSLALADLNEDGLVEIYLANASWDSLYIFTFDGEELVPSSIPADRPRALASGIDADGPYLAIAWNGSEVGKINISDAGDYTMESQTAVASIRYIETHDLDVDGYDDLIYASDQRVYVAQGLADLAWRGGVEVATVLGNRNVEVTDYDNDGFLDLVLGNFSLFELKVARQSAGWNWERVELDFDTRSYLSFSIVSGSDRALVDGVLYDDIYSGGEFVQTVVDNSTRILNVTLKDITGNGATDILYHADVRNAYQLLEGQSDFHRRSTTLDPSFGNSAMVVDDLNADGRQDVIFVEGGFLQWFEGRGAGLFSNAKTLQATDLSRLHLLHDIDGDGDLDILATNASDKVSVYYRNGSTYSPATTIYSRSGGRDVAFSFQLTDIDNDGDVDILATDFYGGVVLFRQSTPSSWSTETYISEDRQINDGVVLDVNGDATKDMALLKRTGGGPSFIELYVGGANGGSSTGVIYNSPQEAQGLAVRDVNADGRDDIIILHTDDNEITTIMQRSDGSWTSPILLDQLSQPARMIQSTVDDLVVVLGGNPNNSRLYTYDFSGAFAELEAEVFDQTCGNNGTIYDDTDDFISFSIRAMYGPAINDEYRIEIPDYDIVLFERVGESIDVVLPSGSAGAGDFEVEISIAGEEQVIIISNTEPCSSIDQLTDLHALMIIYQENNGPNWDDDITFDQDAWRNLYSDFIAGRVTADQGRHCSLPGVTCDTSQRVTQLVLRDVGMTGTLSDAVGLLTELINLNVAVNSLAGLSPFIQRCTKLKFLDWTFNEMEGELLPEIGNCLDLKTIKLSLNRHSGPIPESWSQLTELEELIVGNASQFDSRINRLTSLPQNMGNWTKIHNLNLRKCAFTEPIPQSIGDCVALEYLRLNDCEIPGEIPESISNLTNIIQLDLRENNLTGSLPDSLHLIYSDDLDAIYLQGNQLTGCIPPTYSIFCDIRQLFLNQDNGIWNTATFCSTGAKSCGLDLDMDGFTTPDDCDDADANVNPSAVEVSFNSIDENCDGILSYPCYEADRDMLRDVSAIEKAVILCDKNPVEISLQSPDSLTLYPDCIGDSDAYEGWAMFRATSGSLYFSAQSDEVALSYALYELDTFPAPTDMQVIRCFTSDEACSTQNGFVGMDAIVPLDAVSSDACHPTYGGFLKSHDVDPGPFKYYAIRLVSSEAPSQPIVLDLCGNVIVEQDGSGCDDVLVFVDHDGDGWPVGDDCDDADSSINPGEAEILYNDVDEDCDGIAENQCGPLGQRINIFDRAQYVCDKSTITVQDWNVLTSEGLPFNCREAITGYGFTMAFLKIKVKVGGSLYFKITPEEGTKDVDFVVFEMSDNFDLNTREQVRCIYAGAGSTSTSEVCFTSTGLRPGDTDLYESRGCRDFGVDSYGAPLETEDGDEYLLVIRSSILRGTAMEIEWCGTALLIHDEEGDVCNDLFVSNEDVIPDDVVRVYPNPASGLLHLELEGNLEDYKVSMVNLVGQGFPLNIQGRSADISAIPPGVYVALLEHESGRVWSERIVVY